MNKYYSLFQKEGSREASIDIYGDITSWPWYENDVSSYTLSKEIEGLDVDVIHVYINSYGGEVPEGWAIYNKLVNHKAKIITHNDALAASIASVIFMAGDERIMSNPSLLFVHNAWTYTAGNADDLRKTADELATMSELSKNVYLKHLNISEDKLDELLKAESYITPTEALEMGFATAIVNDNSGKNPSQSAKKKVIEQLVKPVATPKEPINPPEPPKEPEPQQNSLKTFLAGFKTC